MPLRVVRSSLALAVSATAVGETTSMTTSSVSLALKPKALVTLAVATFVALTLAKAVTSDAGMVSEKMLVPPLPASTVAVRWVASSPVMVTKEPTWALVVPLMISGWPLSAALRKPSVEISAKVMVGAVVLITNSPALMSSLVTPPAVTLTATLLVVPLLRLSVPLVGVAVAVLSDHWLVVVL